MMQETVWIQHHEINLARPFHPGPKSFVGRETELRMCRAAWRIDALRNSLRNDGAPALSFRLQGPPGVGKNELVYQLARELTSPLYVMQGHEEFTPEDLSLVLAPTTRSETGMPQSLSLRASPLATAIHLGGLFFFDEINRVPERSLAALASVLDGRLNLYSAMTGLLIEPRDDQARRDFRFCCALNPGLSHAGYSLPDYIQERTLPIIKLGFPPVEEVLEILKSAFESSPALYNAFKERYSSLQSKELSLRQLLAMFTFALNYQTTNPTSEEKAIDLAFKLFMP